MTKLLTCLTVGALGLLSACSSVPNARTNYVAPSAAPTRAQISSAQESTGLAQKRVTSAQTHAQAGDKRLAAAAAKAKTAKEKLVVIAKAVEAQPAVLTLVVDVGNDIDTLTQELLGAQDESRQLQVDLAEAQTQHVIAQTALVDANNRLSELQVEVSKQADLLNTANRERNAAITQGAVDKHNAHVFKWIIIGCAAAIAGLLVFAIFGALSFAPPLLYLLIGAPAAITVFLFFFLG